MAEILELRTKSGNVVLYQPGLIMAIYDDRRYNLSVYQMTSDHFIEAVRAVCTKYGWPEDAIQAALDAGLHTQDNTLLFIIQPWDKAKKRIQELRSSLENRDAK